MVIYVDIDETICHHVEEDSTKARDYEGGTPIVENIKKINELYHNGHTIVYWTARGSVTGIDWTEITEQQLNDWGALHHELRMKKPHYDLFICDKAVNSNTFFRENKLHESSKFW